jgi:hypothetical protein
MGKALAIMFLLTTGAAAAEPQWESDGRPMTPHQWTATAPVRVKERSPANDLIHFSMPASPHQISVLTRRTLPPMLSEPQ